MDTIVNSTCNRCGGYLQPPLYWHGTTAPMMCTCPRYPVNNLSWECIRCHRINSPYKESCDCNPVYTYQYEIPV